MKDFFIQILFFGWKNSLGISGFGYKKYSLGKSGFGWKKFFMQIMFWREKIIVQENQI